MADGSGDEFDIFGYFAGFWLFIFSPKFRDSWISDFLAEGVVGKLFSLFSAGLSVLFGLVLPSVLVYYLATLVLGTS